MCAKNGTFYIQYSLLFSRYQYNLLIINTLFVPKMAQIANICSILQTNVCHFWHNRKWQQKFSLKTCGVWYTSNYPDQYRVCPAIGRRFGVAS